MTDAHNTPETLETELNRLVLLLEAVESAWVYAVYDDVPTRDQLIATMRERLAPIAVLERSLAGSGENSPLEFAQQTPVLPNQSAPVICFTGLGNAIMQGHLPNLLDLHREALASTRHRLVFWVRENEWVELLETARNFSSRIAASFDFRLAGQPLGNKPRTEQTAIRSTKQPLKNESLDKLKVKSIKKRIGELNENNAKHAQKLARLYSELGHTYQGLSRPLWLDAEAAHLQSARFFETIKDCAAQAQEIFYAGETAERAELMTNSLQHYLNARNLFIEIGDSSGQATALGAIGNIEMLQGNYEEALQNLGKSLKIFLVLDDFLGQGNVLNIIGGVNQHIGNFDSAIEFYYKSLKFFTKAEQYLGQANALFGISQCKKLQSKYDEAIQSCDKAFEIYFQIDHRIGQANAVQNTGDIKLSQRKLSEALKNYEKAFEISLQINYRVGQANSLNGIGNVKRSRGEFDEAIQNYKHAISIFIETNNRESQAVAASNLSQIAVLQGNWAESDALLQEALEINQKLGNRHNYALVTGNYGEALMQAKRPLQAHNYIKRAIKLFKELGVPETVRYYQDILKSLRPRVSLFARLLAWLSHPGSE